MTFFRLLVQKIYITCTLLSFATVSVCSYQYDLICIGGGVAGAIGALRASGEYRLKSLVVEEERLHNHIFWQADIPLYALLGISYLSNRNKQLQSFGLLSKDDTVFKEDQLEDVLGEIKQGAAATFPEYFFEIQGVKFKKGKASLVDEHTIEVNGEYITSRYILIGTGSVPYIPDIKGIEHVPYLVPEEYLQNVTLPRSVIIVGGGELAITMAFVFALLSVDVTVIVRGEDILPTCDKEILHIIKQLIKETHMHVCTSMTPHSVSHYNDTTSLICYDKHGEMCEFKAEKLFLATGRKPRTAGLNLESVGVKTGEKGGIEVNGYYQTVVPSIYACGDVVAEETLATRFTYMQSRVAVQHMFGSFWEKKPLDKRNVAHRLNVPLFYSYTGLTEEQVRETYKDQYTVYKYPYKTIIKAHIDSKVEGLVKFIVDQQGRLLGAHAIGEASDKIVDTVRLDTRVDDMLASLMKPIRVTPNYTDLLIQFLADYKKDFPSNDTWFARLYASIKSYAGIY